MSGIALKSCFKKAIFSERRITEVPCFAIHDERFEGVVEGDDFLGRFMGTALDLPYDGLRSFERTGF
jgi:hypothetical protein